MYTQTKTNKTSQLKAGIPEKFLKNFSDRDENISLKYIKNDQLLLQTKNLVQKERQINIQVLQHLQEIEKRKLYLDRGFPSLFEYAVKELGYSHSAAYRRIKSMRLCRDIPQAESKIKTGSLNLTTASQLQTFFEKKKRKDKEEEKNLSIEKTSNLVYCNLQSTFLPAAECVKETKEQDTKTLENNNPTECNVNSTFLPAAGCVKENGEQDKKTTFKLNSDQKMDLIKKAENQSSRELEKTLFDIDPEVNSTKEKVRNIKSDKVEIKVILDKKSQAKLEVLKKLLSHKNPNMSYGELISLLAEIGLNKYDSKRKIKKQSLNKTSAKKQAVKIDKQTENNKADIFMQPKEVFDKKSRKTSEVKIDKKTENNKADVVMQSKEVFDKETRKTSALTMKKKFNNDQKYLKPKRYIPSKVRHRVWMRDQGKCTYVCPKTKRRCASDHLLQIDHINRFH